MMFRTDQPWRSGVDTNGGSKNPLWKSIVIGAAVAVFGSMAGWLGKTAWGGVTASITEGKADVAAVEELKKENDTAHQAIQTEVSIIKDEQQDTNKLLKKVARKLKVE
jgi:hypothetical protein